MTFEFNGLFTNKIVIVIRQNKFKRWHHNSTSTPTKSESTDGDESRTTFESLVNSTLKQKQKSIPSKKLTEQLIAQGLLTKTMIEDLKREWKDE